MKNWKVIVLVAGAALGGVAAFLAFGLKSGGEAEEKDVVTEGKRLAELRKKKRKRSRKNRDGKADGVKVEKTKPSFAIDDDDESHLNEEQRKTIEAIRDALADNDKPRVLKLVQKMQSSDEWPDGIPKSIKMAAIEALGWFGVSCLPEIAGFLADSNEEVVKAAEDKFQEALADSELSDYERSDILIQASKLIDDSEVMDSMLFELTNMRPSVRVKTMKVLIEEGNAATQKALPGNIEFITGEDYDPNAPLEDKFKQLEDYYKANPDDPEVDPDFYGRGKDGTRGKSK